MIILFRINHLFQHSEVASRIAVTNRFIYTQLNGLCIAILP